MRLIRLVDIGLAMVLASVVGCSGQAKMSKLKEQDVESALTKEMLVGRWRSSDSWGFPVTLAVSEVDGALAAKLIEGDNNPLTFKGITIEGAKVSCYIDSGPLGIYRPRSDYYFRVSKDRQSLEYNEKPSGTSDFTIKKVFTRLGK